MNIECFFNTVFFFFSILLIKMSEVNKRKTTPFLSSSSSSIGDENYDIEDDDVIILESDGVAEKFGIRASRSFHEEILELREKTESLEECVKQNEVKLN